MKKMKRAKDILEPENYRKEDSLSHVVVNLLWLTEEEIQAFFACVEKHYHSGCGRIVHLLTDGVSQHVLRSCREHKKVLREYVIEENYNPDLLRTHMFPYYFFEENLVFWQKLFSDPDVPSAVYLAFLSDFMWKTCNNVMWPYHYGEEQLRQARERVGKLINQVPDEYILNLKGIDNFHRFYLLGLKSEGKTELGVEPEKLQIIRSGNVVYETKKLEIVLTKFRPVKGRIRFVAFIKSPVFNFCEKPTLWMEINGDREKRREIPLKKSSWRFYKTKEETNSFYTFVLNIDTTEVQKFHFYVKVNDTVFDTYYYFMPEVVFNVGLNRYRYYRGKTEYRFDHNTFLVNQVSGEEIGNWRSQFEKQFAEKEPEVIAFRREILAQREKKRTIWLYYDCKGVYKDNGYYQFSYDFEKKDGVERYYILNNDIESCRELFTGEQLSHVVMFGSEEHRLLYCLANKVITAYIEKNNYLPFSDSEYAKVMDVAAMPMLVYLQHGVYHAYIPWKYSLDRLQVDKKVISAKFEMTRDLEGHCFTKMYNLPVCMPRHDFMDPGAKPKKKILFAPSWRKYLVDMVNKEWVTREDIFLASRFYKETSAFLQDESLIRFLKRRGYVLEFKLHPILMRYAHLYQVDGEAVTMARPAVKEEEYAIFITDFSNYVFDFAYLERAIMYFFADYEEFRSGMSDYRQCMLSFEDGLGEFADNAKEAVRILKKMIRRGGRPAPQYAKRMEDMFYYKDNGARQRIYESLSGKQKCSK